MQSLQFVRRSFVLFVCLIARLFVSRITHERVYGCQPIMVGMGKG